MDAVKTFLYTFAVVVLPGAVLLICLLTLVAITPVAEASLGTIGAPEWMIAFIITCILGQIVSGGGAFESWVWTRLAGLLGRRRAVERMSSSAALVRERLTSEYGLDTDELSNEAMLRICCLISGPSASIYERYVALRDTMRSLGFVATACAVVVFSEIIFQPEHGLLVTLVPLRLAGLKLPGVDSCLLEVPMWQSVAILVGLIAARYVLRERENHFRSACEAMIYPITLLALGRKEGEAGKAI